MANGYKPVKPEDPSLEGYTFAGWCTLDGTEYDFSATVLKSVTVYAKWINGAGITYIAYENEPSGNTANTLTWIICVAVGLLAAVVSALIILGGRKRVNKKK